jgi:hypothetical protein
LVILLTVRYLFILFDSFGTNQAVYRNLWYIKSPLWNEICLIFGLIYYFCPGSTNTTFLLPDIYEQASIMWAYFLLSISLKYKPELRKNLFPSELSRYRPFNQYVHFFFVTSQPRISPYSSIQPSPHFHFSVGGKKWIKWKKDYLLLREGKRRRKKIRKQIYIDLMAYKEWRSYDLMSKSWQFFTSGLFFHLGVNFTKILLSPSF